MSGRRRPHTIAATAVVVGLVTVLTGGGGVAGADPGGDAPGAGAASSADPPADPDEGDDAEPTEVVDPAVTSLVEDGASPGQAAAQMAAQVAADQAEMDLPPELRAVYGGRRIFHDQGGLVRVAVTSDEWVLPMRDHFVRAGVPLVEIDVVGLTEAEVGDVIEAAQASILSSRPAGADRLVDLSLTEPGTVTVEVAPGKRTPAEAAVVARAEAAPGLYRIVPVDAIVDGSDEACDMSGDIECDPPLRGGVLMHTPGVCTVGFVARSRSDNAPYVLTAGHCGDDYGVGPWVTQFADDSNHNVGPFHRWRDDSQTDVGIIRVANPNGWAFGWPLVTVSPTGGEARQENYVIERVLNPGVGNRICFTGGNSARTDCGTLTALYVTRGGTAGLFLADGLCSDGGDSGGSYFASNVAYGVHVGSTGDGCNPQWGEQAPEAEDLMNVDILTA